MDFVQGMVRIGVFVLLFEEAWCIRQCVEAMELIHSLLIYLYSLHMTARIQFYNETLPSPIAMVSLSLPDFRIHTALHDRSQFCNLVTNYNP